MAVDHYRQHRSAAELIDMAKKRKEEEEKKRVYGPSLPSGNPVLKNAVSNNSKERLYVRKDEDLTPDQIIRKYQFVVDDTSMDYDRKRKMIKEGQKSLSRIRDREIFQDILGTPETNYRSQIADLSARLSAQTKRTAFGSGFGRAAGLDTYHAAVERLSDATGNTGIADNIRKVRAFSDETEARNPEYASAGRFAGEAAQALAMYGTLGAAAEGGIAKLGTKLPGVSAFANKNALTRLGSEILAQQVVDTAVMQPAVILQGVSEGKTRAEILEEMKRQALTDLLFNTGMGVAGAGIKAIGKYGAKKGIQNPVNVLSDKVFQKIYGTDGDRLVKQVQESMQGKMKSGDLIYAGETPSVLKKYGVSARALSMKQSTIPKTVYPAEYRKALAKGTELSETAIQNLQGHNLGFEVFRVLPEKLKKPVAILKSSTQKDSVVVLTDLIDTAGRPVIVPIHIDKNGQMGITNEIASIYGRKDFIKFLETETEKGNLLFLDKKRNLQTIPADGLQLSEVDTQADPIFHMVTDTPQNVKDTMFPNNGQTGNTVLHEKMNASGAAGTSKNISSMNLSSDMKNGLYGRTAGKNENPLLMPEARARLEEELRDLQDVDSLDQKYNEIFLREGEEAADAFLKKNEQRKEEIMDMLYMPLKKEELQKQRINHALQKEVSSLLSYSGKENKKVAQEAIARAMMEVRRNGSVSEETRKKLFETLFDMGKVTNRQNINQEVKDALKKSKFSISSQDAANIADFDTFRKNLMGKVGSVTKDGKNTRVDVAYQELSERFPEFFPDSIVHPAEQLRQIAKVAGDMKIQEFPLKDVTSAEEKELMMQEFLEKFSSAEKQYQDLVRFEAERKARQRQRILESGEDIDVSQLSAADIQKLYDRKYQLQKKAERAKANKILTEGDHAILQKFLHGEISEETIRNTPGVNADAVLEIAEVVKPYKKVSNLIGNSKKNNYEKRMQFIKDTVGDIQIGGKDGWKEPGLSISLMRLSPERAAEKVAPKEIAKKINDNIFAKLHDNERDKTLFVRDTLDKARPLKIGTKKKYTVTMDNAPTKLSESGMVQYLGEKRFDLKKLESSTNLTVEEMKRMEQLRGEIKEAESQIDAGAMERINKGISEIQKIYKGIHPKINEVLIRNGYDPVGYIDGYFPHMFFNDPTDTVGKALNKLGINLGYTELPADISGKTETFRPGRKFSGNLLKREGVRTDYDALRGLENYLYSIGDVIYHTDDIRTLRALEDHLRYQLSPTAVKEEIDAVHNNFDLDLEQKQAELDRLYEKYANLFRDEHNKTLQNYVTYLRRYTDLLAGKKHALDRPFETDITGRGAYSRMDALNQRIAANMVGGNIGSALTNVIPFTQGFAPISMKNRAKGLQEGIAAVFSKNPDALTKKSAFLTTRTNTDKLYKTAADKFSDFAGGLMDIMDKFSTQSVWRGRYYDNINKGMAEKEAIREADDYARRLFGGRSKGAVPPIMQAKNPISKALTMFQLEVNNQIDFLTKDIPKETKGSVVKGLRMYGEILAASYFFNDVYEKMTGRRSALDPVGIALDSVADFSGTEVRNSIDIIADLLHGEGLQLTEEKEPKSTSDAILNLGENIGANVPFIGGWLFEGGRIPQSSALPNPWEMLKSALREKTGDAEEGYASETFKDEFLKPLAYLALPSGGGQIKKTLQGLETMNEGGSYKMGSEGEKLQFAVDTKDPASWVKAALFGKWALPEGQAYINKEVNGLSEKRTEMQREMQQQFGTTPKAYFDTFQNINKAETREGKVSALKSSGLTDAEKEYIYKREIFTGKTQIEDFDKMRSFGLSFDQAAGAQTALEGIQKKYDEMLNDGLKDKNTMAANEKYDYINQMPIPAGQKQKMLENFAVATRWIPRDATPTLMNEKYQAVSGFMSVDDFEVVRGAVSDVISKEEWTKGLKNDRSRYIKAAIDQYTQGMPYAQKRELYKTFGVAKSLW